MKLIFIVSISASLLMPALASAWQDNIPAYWRDNRSIRGNQDASGNTAGNTESSLQFDVQMRGSGDADAYVYGTLGEGWDEVQIHRYNGRVKRSDHATNYRPSPRDHRWPPYKPGYAPGPVHYGQKYPGERSGRYPEKYPGSYR